MEMQDLLCILEERLSQHDTNRKEVQSQLQEIHDKKVKEADLLEEQISNKIHTAFTEKEECILSLIEKINNENDKETILNQAREELSKLQKYEIVKSEEGQSSYKLNIIEENIENDNENNNIKCIGKQLENHLSKINEIMNESQNKLTEICTKMRNDAEKNSKNINENLEKIFNQEDSRIQNSVKLIKENIDNNNDNEIKEIITKVKISLVKNQKYSIGNENNLKITHIPSFEFINFEQRKSTNITSTFSDKREVIFTFSFFNDEEFNLLKTMDLPLKITVKIWKNQSNENDSELFSTNYNFSEKDQKVIFSNFLVDTTYSFRLKLEYSTKSTQWSDEISNFTTLSFNSCCVWKKCPENIIEESKYSVDVNNPRTASAVGDEWITIIGDLYLPPNKVTSWNIKLVNSRTDDGHRTFIGIAPFDIDQNEGYENFKKCGWYYNCGDSTLCSGPPHNYYENKAYGPRKEYGEYVHTGDSIGVTMDTTNGTLSFAFKKLNYGAAYENIPLDKPLVPCVILWCFVNIIELDLSLDYKENGLNSSIDIPKNVTVKCDDWGTVKMDWDKNTDENVQFYQIEINGSKFLECSTTNSFVKRGFFSNTDYSFRVRTVRANEYGEWSDSVKIKTSEAPDFSNCIWKKCPVDIPNDKKYCVDEKNPKIVSKVDGGYSCVVMGNTFIPFAKNTFWRIKIAKITNEEESILIGVIPSDFDPYEERLGYYGWYIDCYDVSLWPGCPQKHIRAKSKDKNGEYVRGGDYVGVTMDMLNGKLSFDINGMKMGDGFNDIPLDVPLVPCVIMGCNDNSVELVV